MTNQKKYERQLDEESEDFGGTYKPSRDPFLREEIINRNVEEDIEHRRKKKIKDDLFDKPMGGFHDWD